MSEDKTHEDGFSVDTLELFACADMNFDNVIKMAPALLLHPIMKLARDQLKAAIARIEKEADL